MLTMVSYVPFKVRTESPTVLPPFFELEPSDTVKPVTAQVPEDAFFWYDPGLDRPKIKTPVPALEFANGVIRDYQASQMVVGADSAPALFYVEGYYEPQKKHAEITAEALRKQRNWFSDLVKQADVDFIGSKGNPFVVSDLARRAARLINVQRQWLDVDTQNTQCPVCRDIIHPLAIVCRSCGAVINKEEYAKFQFAEKK